MQKRESSEDSADSHQTDGIIENKGDVDTNVSVTVKQRPLNRSLSNVVELTQRPVSPDPTKSAQYEETDACDIPYCPVHGIMNTRRTSSGKNVKALTEQTSRRELTRSKTSTIILDGGDDGDDERKSLGQIGRSVSDGHLLKPRTAECVKNAQKRRMRELIRNSSDKIILQSVETRDLANIEFRRRVSAPPRVKLNDVTKTADADNND